MNRLDQIKQLRSQQPRSTLRQIGQRFNITPERVRQILLQKQAKKCPIHNIFITNQCRWCIRNQQLLLVLKEDSIQKQINRLSSRDRSRQTSTERTLLIKKLRNKPYKMSFRQIGQLLGRDHTTILHLSRVK
jgi:chromosomal replication initiation ATPase DnaA